MNHKAWADRLLRLEASIIRHYEWIDSFHSRYTRMALHALTMILIFGLTTALVLGFVALVEWLGPIAKVSIGIAIFTTVITGFTVMVWKMSERKMK